jgi:hypothetical protein
MRVFELENNLGSDDCTMVNREFVNKSVNDYNLYNMFFTSDCKKDNLQMKQFMTDNPNLHYRDGYGYTNACVVDMDSELRNDSKITHDKTKIQLCSRWNTAVPNLGKGGLIPNIESRLKSQDDTSINKDCSKIAERNFDRFTPLIGCIGPTIQDPKHIIMDQIRGGDITRNYIFSNEYLSKCGFKFNGQFYEKQNTQQNPKQFHPLVQGK